MLLAALPALAAALLGLAHPTFLTPDTAERWSVAHLALLPVFPLVGLVLVWLLRGERSPLAWAARVLAYGWAVLYGALDSIAGIGAPHRVTRAVERGAPVPAINDLYEIGDRLGVLGAHALAVAAVLTTVVLLRRSVPLAVLGGGLVAVGAEVVRVYHVFPYRGVGAMALIAAGTALLAGARETRRVDAAPPGAARPAA